MTIDFEAVKRRHPIVSVIERYVDIHKAGKNYKGLCPFHSEKHPSFEVSAEYGRFKCRSCGAGGEKGGSVLDFIMLHHKCDIGEAVRILEGDSPVAQSRAAPSRPAVREPEPPKAKKPPYTTRKGERHYKFPATDWEEIVYDFYTDENGMNLFEKVRFDHIRGERPKDFRQRIDKGDHYIWSLAELDHTAEGGEDLSKTIAFLPEVLAAIVNGEEIFMGEGEKAALAIRKAGGTATCTPDGASGPEASLKWNDRYGRHLSGAHIVYIADRDAAGEHTAKLMIEKLTPYVASIKAVQSKDAGPKADAFDHFEAGGWLGDFSPAPHLEPYKEPRAFELIRFADLALLPKKRWLIEKFLGIGDMGMSYGAPGAGKTFHVADLIGHLIRGETLYANRFEISQPATVVYAAGEKRQGVPGRFMALREHMLLSDQELERLGIFLRVPQLFDLSLKDNVDTFIRELKTDYPRGFDMLVIDTKHAATVGAQENDASDSGVEIYAVNKIIDAFGCAVWLNHHPTKGNNSPRGSGAWPGALDTIIEISRNEFGVREMRCEKLGDAPDKFVIPFDLVAIPAYESMAVNWGPAVDAVQVRRPSDEALHILRTYKMQWLETKVAYSKRSIDCTLKAFEMALNRLADKPNITGVKSQPKNPAKDLSKANPLTYQFDPARATSNYALSYDEAGE